MLAIYPGLFEVVTFSGDLACKAVVVLTDVNLFKYAVSLTLENLSSCFLATTVIGN